MRKSKHSYLFFLILLVITLVLLSPFAGNAQNSLKAFKQIEKYKEQVLFQNGITTTSIEEFQKLFSDTALVVFDIPLLDTASRNQAIKPISKDEGQSDKTISLFSKKMPVKTYTQMLQLYVKEPTTFKEIDIKIDGSISELEKNDTTKTFYFKLKKKFSTSDYFGKSGEVNYIVTVFSNGKKTLITDISTNEFPNDLNLKLDLINQNTKEPVDSVFTIIELENSNKDGKVVEKIILKEFTDSDGIINIPNSVNAKSKITIAAISDSSEIDYKLSSDYLWMERGSDPNKEFLIYLLPYQMKAVSATLFVSGGLVSQTPVSMTNFENGSFDENISYKIGGGILVNWFWNADNWTDLQKTNPVLFGLTFGLSYSANKLSTSSSGFVQNKYDHLDVTGQESKVEYSSVSLTETDNLPQIGLPLLLNLNLKLGKKGASLLFGIGAKFNYNLQATYKVTGTFSRHGYYAINDYSKPITDAPEFNYYTIQNLSYEGDLTLNLWMTEAMFRMSGLLPVIDGIGRKYNLEIGLEFTYPITKNNRYYKSNFGITSENAAETNYWINTGEDNYHSLIYGNERVYNYYVGLSIGFNIVGFVAKKKENYSQQGGN